MSCRRCNKYTDGFGLCPTCLRDDRQEKIAKQAASERERSQKELLAEQKKIADKQTRDRERSQRELLAEQKKIADKETRERERIQKEAQLNDFKVKLVDVAVLNTTDPEKAAAAARVLVRSTIIKENVEWFWDEIFSQDFLRNIYHENLLSPLLENSDGGTDFLEFLNETIFGDAKDWLGSRPANSEWRRIVLPKYQAQLKILEEKAAKNEACLKALEEKEAKEIAKATARDKLVKFLTWVCCLPFMAIFIGIGWLAYHRLNGTYYGWHLTSDLVGIVSALVIYVVMLLIALCEIRSLVKDSILWGSMSDNLHAIQWLSASVSAVTVWSTWNQAADTRVHLGMLAAVAIVPFLPIIREILAFIAVSLIASVIATGFSYFGGNMVSWVSHEHPTKHVQSESSRATEPLKSIDTLNPENVARDVWNTNSMAQHSGRTVRYAGTVVRKNRKEQLLVFKGGGFLTSAYDVQVSLRSDQKLGFNDVGIGDKITIIAIFDRIVPPVLGLGSNSIRLTDAQIFERVHPEITK